MKNLLKISLTFLAIATTTQCVANNKIIKCKTLKTMAEQGVEKGHTENPFSIVNSASLNPINNLIVTASGDKTAKIWDLDGNLVQTLEGHTATVKSVCFSPCGKLIATGAWDGTVKLWDLDGACLEAFQPYKQELVNDYIYSVSFSMDGNYIVAAYGDNRNAKIFCVDGSYKAVLRGHTHSVCDAKFSPDGQTIATGSRDKTIKLWDLDGNCTKTIRLSDWAHSVDFSTTNNNLIVYALLGHEIIIHGIQSNKSKVILHKYACSAKFTPDGKYIIAETSKEEGIIILDLEGNILIRIPNTEGSGVNSASLSSDGKFFMTAYSSGTIKLWDLSLASLSEKKETQILFSSEEELKSFYKPTEWYLSPEPKSLLDELD